MTIIPTRGSDDPIEDSRMLQDAVSKLGFDWPDVDGVLDKVAEEVDELRTAIADEDRSAITHEFGDVIFALINLARFCDLDFREVLGEANARFRRRFIRMHDDIQNSGRTIELCTFDDLNAAWERAKEKG